MFPKAFVSLLFFFNKYKATTIITIIAIVRYSAIVAALLKVDNSENGVYIVSPFLAKANRW